MTSVRVGVMVHDRRRPRGRSMKFTGVVAVLTQPWLAPVTDALADHRISVEVGRCDQGRSGCPDSAIGTKTRLLDAARQLCEAGRSLGPDAIAVAARRSSATNSTSTGLRCRKRNAGPSGPCACLCSPDGTTKVVWIMDPETAATVREVFDRATSPKRGGVRFVDPAQKALAGPILEDDRTTDQLASDAFEHLLKLGTATNPDFMLGSGAPVIRVTTTRRAVEIGVGLRAH